MDGMYAGFAGAKTGHRRTPGMQYQGESHPRAQMFWVGGNGLHRLRCGLEQQVIDYRAIAIG
jgi:hypothetical protein